MQIFPVLLLSDSGITWLKQPNMIIKTAI